MKEPKLLNNYRRENMKKAILETSPDPLFVSTDKIFLYVNKSGAQVLGYENPDTIIGKELDNILPLNINKSIITSLKQRLEGKDISEIIEIPIQIDKNRVLNMEAHIRLIDFDGTPAILTSMRDVTSLINYQHFSSRTQNPSYSHTRVP